jgi:hypothetical protein
MQSTVPAAPLRLTLPDVSHMQYVIHCLASRTGHCSSTLHASNLQAKESHPSLEVAPLTKPTYASNVTRPADMHACMAVCR